MSRTPTPLLSPTYIQWTDPSSPLPRFIRFDVVESEKHTFTSVVSEHPVEDGANIGDHVRHDLDQITLEIFATNSPITNESLTWQNERAGGVVGQAPLDYSGANIPDQPFPLTPGAIFGAIGTGVRNLLGLGYTRPLFANVLNFGLSVSDASSRDVVFAELRKLKLAATPVEIITGLDIYEDMILIGIDVPRTPKEGNAIRATLNFKNIRKVQSKLVSAPKSSIPTGEKTQAKGKQDTKVVEDGPQKTTLKAGYDKLAGALGLPSL